MSDIVKRLENVASLTSLGSGPLCAEAAAEITAARARIAELERLLNARDKFIVDQGMWAAFVESLPWPNSQGELT